SSNADTRLEIDATRARQTERPPAPFRDVLAGGVSLLMSGAEVATHVMAGPVMAAAVHDARVGAVGTISGGAAAPGAFGAGAAPVGAAGVAAAAAAPGSGMSNIQSMMQDGQSSNMQMLALQQQVQEESQRFTTVSNVMRAKYDTAKAAVSNIRA
ncbi:MAG TPA: hypothetical protein VI456_10505, partial [Polyangia bacterium]